MKKLPFIILLFSVIISSCSSRADKQAEEQAVAFPSELGIGQTWNRSLTKRIGQIIGFEARLTGDTSLPLPPFRYGESNYLMAELGIEMTKGLHASIPLTGIDHEPEGNPGFRVAFRRIVEESGVLTEKTYPDLSAMSEAEVQKEKESHAAVALQACCESLVLLKNKDTLLPADNPDGVEVVWWDAGKAKHPQAKADLKALSAQGKPVVLVLCGYQSFALDTEVESLASAIIAAWFPESAGRELIADVIAGRYNPGSRLSARIYNTAGEVIYPMGHGISFNTVTYSGLTLEPVETEKGKNIIVRFNVTNTGTVAGDEVALLYQQLAAEPTPDFVRLEAFKRTNLKPGETKEIKFTIRPRNLHVFDQEMVPHLIRGEYKLWINNHLLETTFRN